MASSRGSGIKKPLGSVNSRRRLRWNCDDCPAFIASRRDDLARYTKTILKWDIVAAESSCGNDPTSLADGSALITAIPMFHEANPRKSIRWSSSSQPLGVTEMIEITEDAVKPAGYAKTLVE